MQSTEGSRTEGVTVTGWSNAWSAGLSGESEARKKDVSGRNENAHKAVPVVTPVLGHWAHTGSGAVDAGACGPAGCQQHLGQLHRSNLLVYTQNSQAWCHASKA